MDSSAKQAFSAWRLSAGQSTALAVLLAAAVLLPLLGQKPLAAWDEGIYAEISREMLRSPLVPLFNGHPWFEKPPLAFWLTGFSYRLLGVTTFAARLPSALAGVATVGVLHGWLLRRRTQMAAWLCSVSLLATLGFERSCHVGETDTLLALFCCVGLVGLSELRVQQRLWPSLLFWFGLAASLLTKGAAAAPLAITAILVLIFSRDRLHKLAGLPVFLVVLLPWPWLMLKRFGTPFFSELFGRQAILRSTQALEGHHTHWWYYGLVLLATASPFALLYPFALVPAFRRDPALEPWGCFAVVSLLLFTLARTRLPQYAVPLYPVFSLITAIWASQRLSRLAIQWPRRLALSAVVLLLWLASVSLSRRARLDLHATHIAGRGLLHQDADLLHRLDHLYRSSDAPPGSILVWKETEDGSTSIAPLLFYTCRAVIPVTIESVPADEPQTLYSVYTPAPVPLVDEVAKGQHTLLLDTAELVQLPPTLSFETIFSTGNTTFGTVMLKSRLGPSAK